jgi:predicted O-methyltransferase YrrM
MTRTKQLVRALKSILDVAYFPSLLSQRAALDKIEDWPTLVAEVCRYKGRRAIYANQIPPEIGAVCDLVRPMKPKVIVEIGTSQGGTLYLLSRLVQPGGVVISIDLPGGPGSVRPVMRAVYRSFGKKNGVQVITLDRDSHSQATHAEIEQILAGREIDLLFIDGDHSYEGVKADFHAYRRFVAPNGVIAIHDVAHEDRHKTIFVPQFWRELTAQPIRHQAFITSAGTDNSPGIGIVFNDANLRALKKSA